MNIRKYRYLALVVMGMANGAQAATAITGNTITSPSFYSSALGWSFTLTENITVEELGWFDFQQNGLASSHLVGIYNSSNVLLTSGQVAGGVAAPLTGYYRYTDVIDVDLFTGQVYYIIGAAQGDGYVSSGFGTSSEVDLVSGVYNPSCAVTQLCPPTATTTPLFGPNFKYVTTVPIPAAAWLFLSALGGLAMVKRRKR